MQQNQRKLVKAKNFIEFKNWIKEYSVNKDYHVLFFSSLSKNVKDLYLLNSLKRLFSSKKSPNRPLIIVDAWDVPEAFSYFDVPIIDNTPTILMVTKYQTKVSDHLSFIEDRLTRIFI